MLVIAFLYFQNEKTLYFDLIKSNMQNKVSSVSSKIVFAHMTDSNFDKKKVLEDTKFEISFYDKEKNMIFGNLNESIDFTKKIIHKNNYIILTDNSTLGHLGVYYIAIKENILNSKIKELLLSIMTIFVGIYFIIALVGYYLAKLFLRPIKDEREKLNRFIKDTTHELNTPISAILMSSEDKNLSTKQIERIRLSAKRVSEIYKDLSYIFLQKDSKALSLEAINLKDLIEEQLEYFEPLASKKRVNIKLDLNEFEYKIYKDDFIRVFNNLFSNAIKYNKIGGDIFVVLNKNSLIIEDTGIGIKKSRIKDIFTRYYRATSSQGGFGIGLNIVYEICKKYNIKIEVESTYKEKTKIELSF